MRVIFTLTKTSNFEQRSTTITTYNIKNSSFFVVFSLFDLYFSRSATVLFQVALTKSQYFRIGDTQTISLINAIWKQCSLVFFVDLQCLFLFLVSKVQFIFCFVFFFVRSRQAVHSLVWDTISYNDAVKLVSAYIYNGHSFILNFFWYRVLCVSSNQLVILIESLHN